MSRQIHSLSTFREYLGLNRNVSILALSTLGLGLGEELWQAYLPKYLIELGASSLIVGLFASLRDLLDGLYQYPGGWINDRFGRKKTLMLFTLVAMSGYAVFAASFHWSLLFVGLVLVMGWKSGAFPATFSVIANALPKGQRSVAFSVQSIMVRLPRVVGAPVGGLLIVSLGLLAGIRVALIATLALAVIVLVTQHRLFQESPLSSSSVSPASAKDILRKMPSSLKRLLLAECFVRIGEGISLAFIILYVTDILGFSVASFGAMYAIQQSVAIAVYIPSGKLADTTGRKPLVALTFLFFALFPLAVKFSDSFLTLMLAFVVGGLKEFGEPARKSYIVDLADDSHVGRTVGLYYTIRNLLVVPAGTLGGILWQISPDLTMYASCAIGLCGLIIFTVNDKSQER